MNTKALKLKIARTAGFCFGVKRAIELAENTRPRKRRIFTLGPLIHNPQEVERLETKGIKTIRKIGSQKDITLIIRTHGIPSGYKEKLEKKEIRIVDATCPFVKRAQDIVKKLKKEKYQVIIVGEKTHPEVAALVSYGGKDCRVVENIQEIKKLKLKHNVGVISQTTQIPKKFEEIIELIKLTRPRLKVFNTICRATVDRQAEAEELAGRSDVMIIVGGKNSGNTRRLYDISDKVAPTHLVETASEVKSSWFKGKKSVGITAGASTPDWIIEEVKNKIENIYAGL
jgi:(E)-4-hydroxy-3-methyl-but-2-enyl pyrophosphate reductase